ncbi:MAG: RNA polymerase sigma factor, partial [Acidimicrobiia bacterium]
MEPLDARPDAVLVAAVGARGPEALEELYRRHSVAVFGVARRVTGVLEHAEEVLQEVFLRLWRNPERFDPAR